MLTWSGTHAPNSFSKKNPNWTSLRTMLVVSWLCQNEHPLPKTERCTKHLQHLLPVTGKQPHVDDNDVDMWQLTFNVFCAGSQSKDAGHGDMATPKGSNNDNNGAVSSESALKLLFMPQFPSTSLTSKFRKAGLPFVVCQFKDSVLASTFVSCHLPDIAASATLHCSCSSFSLAYFPLRCSS